MRQTPPTGPTGQARQRDQAQLVALIISGVPVSHAADEVGVSRRSVARWRARAYSSRPEDAAFVALEQARIALDPLYLILSFLTLGIWAIFVWDYKIQTDPENLYPSFHSIEDTVLQTVRAH